MKAKCVIRRQIFIYKKYVSKLLNEGERNRLVNMNLIVSIVQQNF